MEDNKSVDSRSKLMDPEWDQVSLVDISVETQTHPTAPCETKTSVHNKHSSFVPGTTVVNCG